MMKRTELERRLTALGYASSGQRGARHTMWYGPRGGIPVPNADLIRDDQAAEIIRRAAGL